MVRKSEKDAHQPICIFLKKQFIKLKNWYAKHVYIVLFLAASLGKSDSFQYFFSKSYLHLFVCLFTGIYLLCLKLFYRKRNTY